jgi:hypothetical protein
MVRGVTPPRKTGKVGTSTGADLSALLYPGALNELGPRLDAALADIFIGIDNWATILMKDRFRVGGAPIRAHGPAQDRTVGILSVCLRSPVDQPHLVIRLFSPAHYSPPLGFSWLFFNPRRSACSQGSHPRGRPLARPAVGSRVCRRRAPARPGPCLTSSTFFWLLSFGF